MHDDSRDENPYGEVEDIDPHEDEEGLAGPDPFEVHPGGRLEEQWGRFAIGGQARRHGELAPRVERDPDFDRVDVAPPAPLRRGAPYRAGDLVNGRVGEILREIAAGHIPLPARVLEMLPADKVPLGGIEGKREDLAAIDRVAMGIPVCILEDGYLRQWLITYQHHRFTLRVYAGEGEGDDEHAHRWKHPDPWDALWFANLADRIFGEELYSFGPVTLEAVFRCFERDEVSYGPDEDAARRANHEDLQEGDAEEMEVFA